MNAGTIGAALTGAVALLRGETDSPQLDAEVLLGYLLRCPRPHLVAHRTEALTGKALRAYTSLVRRRAEGFPLAYLTGSSEFYGRPFIVTPAVMVPRPESETIVEETLRLLDASLFSTSDSLRPIIADIGTGSGVLAVTLAAEAARVRVVATDKSASALVIARRNARKQKVVHRMTFIESDLLTEIPPEVAPHIIVANLPYVSSDELKRPGASLETRGLAFEPQKALDGGPDGLFVIRRFFAQLKRWKLQDQLRHLVLEHSPGQRRRIFELAHDALSTFRPHEATSFVMSWTQGSA